MCYGFYYLPLIYESPAGSQVLSCSYHVLLHKDHEVPEHIQGFASTKKVVAEFSDENAKKARMLQNIADDRLLKLFMKPSYKPSPNLILQFQSTGFDKGHCIKILIPIHFRPRMGGFP